MSDDKRFRCRIGWHAWFNDSALIASVRRCNYCPAVDDDRRAAELDAERDRIAALPGHPSLGDLYRAAAGWPPVAESVRGTDNTKGASE